MSERNSHPLLKPLSVFSDADAYVNAMLRLASSAAVAGYGGAGPYCTAADPFARPRPLTREYDEKALVEIYRSILARGEAGPVVAAARLPAVL